MAIAVDASSKGTGGSTASRTWSHTCTGTDLILVVGVDIRGNGNTCTGVTYNGVSMTEVGTSQVVSTLYYDKAQMFYLLNPDTGTHDVIATYGSANYQGTTAVSYTGVSQVSQPDASTDNSATTTATKTTTLTTVADNCWTILIGMSEGGNTSAGAGTTQRIFSNSNHGVYDSNGAITPAGSTSLQTTQTSQPVVGKMMSISPVGATSAIKTVNGLAIASVKTVNGLAIASVKTINGLA